ncbi:hypothetical protein BDD12DRAFT_827715 [Trichophaea hybrida]|nr:hypothetical protein BDD12DRAFT_827715 [Trichophaea hybrida]
MTRLPQVSTNLARRLPPPHPSGLKLLSRERERNDPRPRTTLRTSQLMDTIWLSPVPTI